MHAMVKMKTVDSVKSWQPRGAAIAGGSADGSEQVGRLLSSI